MLAVQHVEEERVEEHVEEHAGKDADAGAEGRHVVEAALKDEFLVVVELDLARCN